MKTKLLFFLLIFLTIKFSFAQLNCYQQDNGLYQYYAKIENISNVNSNFDKTDFINYITTYGNLTSGDLNILNTDIISVSKSFPSSQTPFLQNVVSIDSNSDIYSIISNTNNSISTIECRNNPILLNIQNVGIENIKLAVTKNPITEDSKLIVNSKIKKFKLILTNFAGQIVYENQYKNEDTIFLNPILKEKGIYILTIINFENNVSNSIKIIK